MQVRDKADFENYPEDMKKDETDVNVRAYFHQMADEKIAEYDANWSDDRVIEWDGNFKNDGSLMIVCSERDVEIDEYREVLKYYLEFREKFAEELGIAAIKV